MKRFIPLLLALFLSSGVRADLIKQNANYHRMVLMTLASDHITGATGLTLTITESKAGAAFAAGTPTVTERGTGWYDVLLTSADDATLGAFNMHITGAAADPTDTADQIVAFDPTDVSLLGLTGVATIAKQNVGLNALVPTQVGTIAAGSLGTSINTTLTAPNINSYKGQVLVFTSGALVGQTHLIASNTTGANSVLTVMTAPAVNPTAGDTFSLVTGIGQKAADFLANAIGTDNRVKISADVHTAGATVAGVTAQVTANTTQLNGQNVVTSGAVTFAPGTVSIYAGADTAGTTTLLTRVPGTIQPQTGDAFARLGAPAGASVSADIAGIWAIPLPGAFGVGTAGKLLSSAGASADPWSIALPGAYGAGTAGYKVGNFLTGDAYARIGAAGAGLTAVGDTAGTTTLLARVPQVLLFDGGGNLKSNVFAINAGVAAPTNFLTTLAFAGGTQAPVGFLVNEYTNLMTLIPQDAAIRTDMTTVLNTAVPGTPTVGSSYALLKSAGLYTDPWATLLSAETTPNTFGPALKAFMLASPSGWLSADTASLNAITANVFSHPVETGVTFQQMSEMIGAYLAGNANFNTGVYYAVGNSTTPRFSFTLTGGVRTVTITP